VAQNSNHNGESNGLYCDHIHEDKEWGFVLVVMGSFNPSGDFNQNTMFEIKGPKHESYP
jgi:hypothetical protein